MRSEHATAFAVALLAMIGCDGRADVTHRSFANGGLLADAEAVLLAGEYARALLEAVASGREFGERHAGADEEILKLDIEAVVGRVPDDGAYYTADVFAHELQSA